MQVSIVKKENIWELNAEEYRLIKDTEFPTYDDHRMAMCVAPLALKEPIRIENENAVQKSYPHFWEDMKSVGFEIKYL